MGKCMTVIGRREEEMEKIKKRKKKGEKEEKRRINREVLTPFACRSRGDTVLRDHFKGGEEKRGRGKGRKVEM